MWLKKGDALTSKQIPPPGYKIHLVPRQDDHQGGGIAIVYKDQLTIAKITEGNQPMMESFLGRLQVKQKSYELLIVYRALNISVLAFIGDLSDLLKQQVTSLTSELVILIDLNIHIDEQQDGNTIDFNDFMDCFNLENRLTFKTHWKGHTLDLIITDCSTSTIQNGHRGYQLCDHCFINYTLDIRREQLTITRKTGNLNDLDHTVLDQIFAKGLSDSNIQNRLAAKVKHYNNSLREALDEIALESTKTQLKLHRQPWYDEKIKAEIALQCKKERTWLTKLDDYSYLSFYYQWRYVANLIKQKKRAFYRQMISDHRGD